MSAIDANPSDRSMSDTIRSVEASRLLADAPFSDHEECEVVRETPLSVVVEDVGTFTIMCTPTDLLALAAGFVFSEGMVDSVAKIISIDESDGLPHRIRIKLDDPWTLASKRNLIVASSCGMCGSRNIEHMIDALPAVAEGVRVSGSFLIERSRAMRCRQQIFQRTGGAHAAAVFSAEGEVLAFAEDIGRHNALDKVIGICLQAGIAMSGRILMLSGRVSLELVAKAARAGLELIAAVSAPSSLAIEVAGRCNITLCGFVRENRVTAYTHTRRITGFQGVREATPK